VVSTVASSQRAKTLFARQKEEFDVLLLNMTLPDGSGVELAEELLEQKPELAVLLISKHSDDDPVVRCLKEKGFSHMCKPFNLTSLLNAVGLAITHRKGQKREGWM
jgi:DNA-binding NtrC family response regulator